MQLSIAESPTDPSHHFDPDEMGEIMWEMRPRFATSAGELKRRKKKEMLAERERNQVRRRTAAAPTLMNVFGRELGSLGCDR